MRKSQSHMDFMGKLLIGIFILAILAMMVGKLKASGQDAADENFCKISVYQHASAKAGPFDFSQNIECPARKVIINNKKEAQARFEIAEELRKCWDNFGQGKLDLFDQEGTFCAVCSTIDFTKKGTLGSLSDYLVKTEIPPPNPKRLSYMDFITGSQSPTFINYYDDPLKFNKDDPHLENEIDTSQRYAVLFVYAKGLYWVNQVKQGLGGNVKASLIGGGIVGGVAGSAAGFTAAILIGSNPVGWAVGALFAVGTGIYTAYQIFTAGEKPEFMAVTFLKPYTNTEFKDLGCQYLPIDQEKLQEFGK